MGFFSEIVSEARRGQLQQPAPQPVAAPMPAAPEAKPAQLPAFPEPPAGPAPAPAPVPAVYPARDGSQPGTPVQPVAQATTTPQPGPPAIDLSPGVQAENDAAKRKAHEAAEAKRKAEWDVKQAEKRAKRQAALDRIAAMNGAELLAAATDRVAADTERLTHRNMKESVAEHIQARCREDATFAMLVMDPAKSMVNCFKYINRQAQAYAEQEMEDEGIQRTGVYGLDVPDGLCYQWTEDYFHDENTKEDHQNEEKFVPKPYVPASVPRKTAKGKTDKKSAPAEKPKAEKPKGSVGMEQISLM